MRERALREYVHDLKRELFGTEAFVHRTHAPGDTLEGDFFESWARIGGSVCKAHVFVGTLPVLEQLLREGVSDRAPGVLAGRPQRELRVLRRHAASRGARQHQRGSEEDPARPRARREDAFHGWRGGYPLHVDFCAPAKGNEKGSVERGNEYVRGLFFRPMAEAAASWDELNAKLLVELEHDLDQRHLPDGRTACQALQAEREHLRPRPPRLPECARVAPCVADKYATVTVDRVRYSVPSEIARRALLAKLYWGTVEIVDGDVVVARHARSYAEGAWVLDAMHVLRLLERKHRAIGESTAIAQMKLRRLIELRVVLRGKVRKPDREWVWVLLLRKNTRWTSWSAR